MRQKKAYKTQRNVETYNPATPPTPFAGNSPGETSLIDKKRYKRIRKFFLRTFLHLIFWDIILNRPALRWIRTDPSVRWRRISRNYRKLAIEMGGVLIKLGQFLSVRVDILPREVTHELSSLRDEIPAEPLAKIIPQIEEDFDRPISELFEWISTEPLGAASLGQVHLARLAANHNEVAVKVLRPGIHVLVETDLSVITLALGWLKRYKKVRTRVDLDWLIREFSQVTRAELDVEAEGKNAERFASDFSNDSSVCVPKVYWQYCGARTLTLENVGYIKISELEKMTAVGIHPANVAKKIYNFYLRQIFETHFVHADPHPGNIFVKPLATEEEKETGLTGFDPLDTVPFCSDRPFQVVFVDFGMVTEIPERLRVALREYVIGVGTRDSYRIVQSYVKAGTLLPDADVKRLEEAHEALLAQFWGANASQMRDVALNEAVGLMREYRDVIYAAPFQFQADMLFAVRAVAILSGIATNLNEEFDPWQEIIPFADRLAADELGLNWQQWLKEIVSVGQVLYKLPKSVETVVSQAKRGDLNIKTSFASDSRKLLLRLEQAINRLSWTVVAIGLFMVGMSLDTNSEDSWLGILMVTAALFFFVWGLWSNRR